MSKLHTGDGDIAAPRAANVDQADYYRRELSRQGKLLADRRATTRLRWPSINCGES